MKENRELGVIVFGIMIGICLTLIVLLPFNHDLIVFPAALLLMILMPIYDKLLPYKDDKNEQETNE